MPSMQFLPGEELAPKVIEELERRGMPAPTIYEKDVVICWYWQDRGEDDDFLEWTDLRVFDLRELEKNPRTEDAKIYANASATTGCIESDWMGNSGRTCQGVFSRSIYDGGVPSGKGYVDVLIQFAKVHECDWARFMLASLYASTIMDADESDLIDPA